MGGPSAGRKVGNSRVGRIRGMVTGALRFGGGHYKIPLTGRLTTINAARVALSAASVTVVTGPETTVTARRNSYPHPARSTARPLLQSLGTMLKAARAGPRSRMVILVIEAWSIWLRQVMPTSTPKAHAIAAFIGVAWLTTTMS